MALPFPQVGQALGRQLLLRADLVEKNRSLWHISKWSFPFLLLEVFSSRIHWRGFPDSSVGKESTCNAGDPGSIPGWERSAGEGIDYPLQYSWASPVAQLVKNPPAMWDTWAGKIPWIRERLPTPVFWPGEFQGLYSPQVAKNWTRLSDFHFHYSLQMSEDLVELQEVKNSQKRKSTSSDWAPLKFRMCFCFLLPSFNCHN